MNLLVFSNKPVQLHDLQGILAEIVEFVMGKELIPVDGEIWGVRRRAIVLALHQKHAQIGILANQKLAEEELLEYKEDGFLFVKKTRSSFLLVLALIGTCMIYRGGVLGALIPSMVSFGELFVGIRL
ncbi:hypothetical protein RHMOL_Rhmol09G0130100 [Rhododendron molle]|uniref:Uncharacterized protein n=1 Tax=Rhododendron molle TaxID=49168 RepID=A0ACC0MDY5_RHOML|nr:hypothetical protein RHMOL_Rhmol09G0130100 [Rhododendron molle]